MEVAHRHNKMHMACNNISTPVNCLWEHKDKKHNITASLIIYFVLYPIMFSIKYFLYKEVFPNIGWSCHKAVYTEYLPRDIPEKWHFILMIIKTYIKATTSNCHTCFLSMSFYICKIICHKFPMQVLVPNFL